MEKNNYIRTNPPAETWAKTFGKCALCGSDFTDHVLMKPENLFICEPCARRKGTATVSEYRDVVFGYKSRFNPKANFYHERLLIEPDFFRLEESCFIEEFNPYL